MSSKLTETKRAYDKIASLLDQEIRKRGSNLNELKRCQEILDAAFYLIGWWQFEFLVRNELDGVIHDFRIFKKNLAFT